MPDPSRIALPIAAAIGATIIGIVVWASTSTPARPIVGGAGSGSATSPAVTRSVSTGPDAFLDETWSGQAGPAKKSIFNGIKVLSVPESAIETHVDASFRGEDFHKRPMTSGGTQSGVQISNWGETPSTLDGKSWRVAFNRYLSGFAAFTWLETHTWRVKVLTNSATEQRLLTDEAIWITGTLADGRIREDRLNLVFEYTRAPGGAFKIAAIRAENGRTSFGPGPFFVDVTAEALPPGYDQTGQGIYTDAGAVLYDFDVDGDVDLFLPRLHAPAKLYANDGTGHFEDVTAKWGLGIQLLAEGTNTGLFIDVNNDGRVDLMVGSKRAGVRLFINQGDRFTLTAESLTGPGEWQALAAADYDNDGDLDVFCCNYGLIDIDHQPGSYVNARDGLPNALLRNDGKGGFTNDIDGTGMGREKTRWAYAAVWCDFDLDGDMDLYVANDYGPNNLWVNDEKDFTFVDEASRRGAEDHGNGMSAAWLDYNGDGLLDLYVSNMQSFAGNRLTALDDFLGSDESRALYRRYSKGNTLLKNDGHSFTDVTAESGTKPAFWAWGAAPFDYDLEVD
jgi:hypothetical protein